jgi:putative NADPH-quinone reductase
VSADPSPHRLDQLLAQLEEERARLEGAEDAEEVVDILGELADLARDVQAEIERIRREGADAVS